MLVRRTKITDKYVGHNHLPDLTPHVALTVSAATASGGLSLIAWQAPQYTQTTLLCLFLIKPDKFV